MLRCPKAPAGLDRQKRRTAHAGYQGSEMTDIEFIGRQALQIEELREELRDMQCRIQKARSHIYCIGGPLNDNKLGYSKPQMVTFSRIAEELGEP
jgi:hypothetical protein